MYNKHFDNCKLMTLEIVNAVACTINTITIIIDNSMAINYAPRVVNYSPRVMPLFGASL
jgi:hypothetical protein